MSWGAHTVERRAGTMRIVVSGFGRSALTALQSVVAEAKVTDPLASVTILVPNNIAGITARRFLADGFADRGGVAGLYVLTPTRLAEQLTAVRLHPRLPATPTVVASSWRSLLLEQPGVFESVRDHPATLRALTSAHRELRDLTEDALDIVAGVGDMSADLVRLHREVTRRLRESWYDTTDLLDAAITLIATEPKQVSPLGALLLYLPENLTRAEIRFVSALAGFAELTTVLGLTGDNKADTAARQVASSLGQKVVASASEVPTATRVVHASDSDDEVRRVVREVMSASTTIAPQRIAVLYSAAVPYARLLHEQLAAAGIAFNGPGIRSVAERALARSFLGILQLTEQVPRAELFVALSAAPVRGTEGTPIPVSRWERVSRLAGVVGGDDWQHRISTYVAGESDALATENAAEAPEPSRLDAVQRRIDAATELTAFAGWLQGELALGQHTSDWNQLGAWALGLFVRLYGNERDLQRLPAAEQYAAVTIESSLRGLASLDTTGLPATLERLVDLLLLDLEAALPRVGRFGEGVFVGPMSSAIGLDADLIVVAGLAEDSYPGRPRDDALLSARTRTLSGELRAAEETINAKRRHLFAAFSSAPTVLATFPHGDLRRSAERLPSRWLLATLKVLTGDTDLMALDWADHTSADVIAVSSFATELRTTPTPATEQEWRVQAIGAGQPHADTVIEAGGQLARARAAAAFTRFDGNLSGAAGLPDYAAGIRSVSPTTLESYAVCPHSFFVRRLLRVEPLQQPEEIITISALDIGNLIHESMDRLIDSQQTDLPGYGEPWSDAAREALLRIASDLADDYQSRGVTGHPLLWQREKQALMLELAAMIESDNDWRREHDARVVASELSFGRGGRHPAVSVAVDGGQVLMVGSADKIDQTRDGTLLVTDIKTGRAQKYLGLKDDPVLAGTKLQLPAYALAARQILGGNAAQAQYWFVRKDRGKRIPVTLNDEVVTIYSATISTLVAGIAGGLFPAKAPDEPDFDWIKCVYCNPDGMGHNGARRRWETKRSDAVLTSLVALIDPEAAEAGDQ